MKAAIDSCIPAFLQAIEKILHLEMPLKHLNVFELKVISALTVGH